jgi:TonB family protein
VIACLARLAVGYQFTRKVVNQSRKLEESATRNLYESSCIVVPMTVGWLHPKILLPQNWREWDRTTLRAVLAHEQAHVERADWAIAAVAAVNRSIFWFHPLAWWLEHTLPRLAEEACDDAALRELECRPKYAQILLQMAAAVRLRRSRTIWEAMAMARVPEVQMRINRILDEARRISPPLSRRACSALLAFGLPIIGAISMLQLAPARAMEQDRAVAEAVPPPQTAEPQTRANPSPAQAPSDVGAMLDDWRRKPAQRAAPLQPITRVAPEYPPAARAAGVRGTVRLTITIGKDGTVTDVTSVTGHPLLIPSATEAVRKWVYSPQRENVQLQVEVPVVPDPNSNPATPQEPAPQPSAPPLVSLTPISRVEPEYPAVARESGAHGLVELAVAVATDGHVTDVTALRGHPMLKRPAQDAVMHWMYPPQSSVVITNAEVIFPAPEPATGGRIVQAILLSKKQPEYPLEARQAGVSGLVEMLAAVGVDGRVKSVRTLKGDPLLIKAAEDCVMQWRYRPTLLNGVPVRSDVRVTLNFVAQGLQPESGPQNPDGTRPALLIRRTEPEAQDADGVVRLRAKIGTDGKLTDIQIEEGEPALSSAALNVVKQWLYRPAALNGTPVESETRIVLRFQGKREH